MGFKNKYSMAVILVIFTLLATSVFGSELNILYKNTYRIDFKYVDIDAETVYQMITKDDCIIIVDIRSIEEYNSGHIKNAFSIPFFGCQACFLQRMNKYNNDEKIIVYGEDGYLSGFACQYLAENNFTNVFHLLGGINLWQVNDFSIVESKIIEEKHERYTSEQAEYPTGLLLSEEFPSGKTFTGFTPTSWDWRDKDGEDWTTSIKDQEECGSCYAFGSYAAMESCIKIENEDPNLSIDLSEQYMVSCGTKWMDGINGCNGAYLEPTMDFIEIYGAIPEYCFPYTSGNGNVPPCSDKCSDWQDLKIEISEWGTVSSSQNSIKNALIEKGPLPTGMDVYTDFFSYSGGVYEYNPGWFEGHHLVTIVGYNDNQNCWICKNSWGKSWGEDGWFRMTSSQNESI